MKRTFLLLAVLLLAVVGVALGASSATTRVTMQAFPNVHVTTAGPAAATITVTGTDSGGRPTKRSIVQKWTIGGNETDVLIRLQHANGALYVDLIADATISSLSTTLNSLDLTNTTIGHPKPTKDDVDSTAITAAGG